MEITKQKSGLVGFQRSSWKRNFAGRRFSHVSCHDLNKICFHFEMVEWCSHWTVKGATAIKYVPDLFSAVWC